jgi:hypothetical protein
MFRSVDGVPVSAAALRNPVSWIIAELETSLGTRLLSRTTRAVALSEREVLRSSYLNGG